MTKQLRDTGGWLCRARKTSAILNFAESTILKENVPTKFSYSFDWRSVCLFEKRAVSSKVRRRCCFLVDTFLCLPFFVFFSPPSTCILYITICVLDPRYLSRKDLLAPKLTFVSLFFPLFLNLHLFACSLNHRRWLNNVEYLSYALQN